MPCTKVQELSSWQGVPRRNAWLFIGSKGMLLRVSVRRIITIATDIPACRGHDLVSLILDDLLEYHHQRSRSHAQHDYAIDGFERAEQLSVLAHHEVAVPERGEIDGRVVDGLVEFV